LAGDGRAVRPVIVCPTWDSQKRRCRGGGRYGVTHFGCGRCGTQVAVSLDVWRAIGCDKDPANFMCEACSLLLEVMG
jgi:hypothetical protein